MGDQDGHHFEVAVIDRGVDDHIPQPISYFQMVAIWNKFVVVFKLPQIVGLGYTRIGIYRPETAKQ